ncbi:MAG: metallophosphoesterase [Tidjanibacter sp.]|nr:metallophosphoesterase [Tidjanibacter sp.]
MVIPILLTTIAILTSAFLYIWRRVIRHKSTATRKAYKCFAWFLPCVIVAYILFGLIHKGPMPHWFNAALAIYILLFLLTSVWVVALALGLWFDGGSGRKVWRTIAIVICSIVTLTVLYGSLWERKQLAIKEVELSYTNLPESFDGLTITLFSDIHLSSMYGNHRMIEKMVNAINSLDTDIAVFAGDLVTGTTEELTPEFADLLGSIRARYGTFSVLGNHDMGIYGDTLRVPRATAMGKLTEKQHQMGWRLLRNEYQLLTATNGEQIAIVGVDYPEEILGHSHRSTTLIEEYDEVFSSLPDSLFRITIAHAPQMWDGLRELARQDLTLSGHVHSMQMKLFGTSPARLFYKRWSGLYEENGERLYITDGIGSVVIPARIGAPPEITIITLRME